MDLFEYAHSEEEKQTAERAMVRYHEEKQARRTDAAEIANRRQYEAMLDSVKDWKLPELPDLSQFSYLVMDLETTGLRWWKDDRMIGAAIWLPDNTTRYLPIRHKMGPNIPEEQFFEWMRREMRGKKVTNIRTKFDLHMLREENINLEEQGCTFGDVAHQAALLDDHRRRFNQEELVQDFLHSSAGKVTEAEGYKLDAGKFQNYPAGLVAQRACGDVLMVSLLAQAFRAFLVTQNLTRVQALEEAVIPAVVEMEHNGAPIDLEKLQRFITGSEIELKDALFQIRRATGVEMRTPDNREDQARVLHALGLQVPTDAESGEPSFADDLLAVYEHPIVFQLRRAKALASLRSKFLLKYWEYARETGILRYELHQLPYKDDTEGGGGAVSGRFSSAAASYYDANGTQRKDGINAQQVMGVKSQYDKKKPDAFWPTKDYIVRSLFIPSPSNPGAGWMSSDMRQIEYRRFVHFSESEQLIASYQKDPLTDYHQLVHGLILKHTGKDFERTHVKNLNFASLYGAGLLKIALMVGEISQKVYQELLSVQKKQGPRVAHADPRIAKTRTLYDTYHKMFPEVRRLLKIESHIAMPRCRTYKQEIGSFKARNCDHSGELAGIDHKGFVETILGRRARFNDNDRFYSALNRKIQGTAAEDNKMALIDVYKERRRLGFVMRFTVHDELCGDLLDRGSVGQMADFLNQQRLESKVAILWDTKVADNWAETK